MGDTIPKVDCDFTFATNTHNGKCVKLDDTYGNQDWRMYPADYGAQCQMHTEYSYKACTDETKLVKDKTPPERLLDPKEDWCKKEWCYVDACKCDTPDVVSSSAFQSHGVELKYSYAACGSVDDWTSTNTNKKVGEGACDVDTSGASALQHLTLFAPFLGVTALF